jgi:hypothetical protein
MGTMNRLALLASLPSTEPPALDRLVALCPPCNVIRSPEVFAGRQVDRRQARPRELGLRAAELPCRSTPASNQARGTRVLAQLTRTAMAGLDWRILTFRSSDHV